MSLFEIAREHRDRGKLTRAIKRLFVGMSLRRSSHFLSITTEGTESTEVRAQSAQSELLSNCQS